MKKILLTALAGIVVSLEVFASPRIVLEDKKENYTQTETGYVLMFKLSATSEELVSINEKVLAQSDRMSFQVSEGTGAQHDCVFTVNHQNQPEYVYKMLLAIGIGDLEYKGNIQALDTIIQILYSYL